MSRKIHCFLLPCDARVRNYFLVEVHPTRASMQKSVRMKMGRQMSHEAEALCLSYQVHSPKKFRGELGTLYFHSALFTPEVVAHELAHAAMCWCRRKAVNPLLQNNPRRRCAHDERHADVVQRLTKYFYRYAGRQLAAQVLADESGVLVPTIKLAA